MIPIFTPRYVKEANAILKNVHKLLCYKRDLLPEAEIARIGEQMRDLKQAARARDKGAVEAAAQKLDATFSKHFPPRKDAGWRENCEVFLVAIVIALGVRTYFLQPFTIPTGSMQPTLNGIIGQTTKEAPPNILRRVAEFAVLGRSYVDVVAKTDATVLGVEEKRVFRFFTVTDIHCENGSYRAWISRDALARYFPVEIGRRYRAGEVIARGYLSAGDHVFVDKMSYNFRKPARGEVFVFKTTNILGIERGLDPSMGSQYYIKRLAGEPNDRLRINPPNLFINGERARGLVFERVMAARDGYRGYASGPAYLNHPNDTFHVPEKSYFAMGDNSYNSLDSRAWGIVPEQNITGRGKFVYWPFTSHWGLIK